MRGFAVFDLVDNFFGMVVQVKLAKLKMFMVSPFERKKACFIFWRTTDSENLASLFKCLFDETSTRKGITSDDD
jgi:hypothetical protein